MARSPRWLAVTAALAPFAAALSRRRLDDFDLPWHLAFGRYVVATRSIPRIDPLAYPHSAISYTDFVPDVALFLVQRATGLVGLQFAGGLLALALEAITFARARQTPAAAALVTTFAMASITSWLVVRPSTLALLLASLVLAAVEEHRRAPDDARGRYALMALVPLEILWSNAHQSGVLGVAIAIGYFAYRAIARVAAGTGRRAGDWLPTRDGTHLPFVFGVAVATLLGACANTAGSTYVTRLGAIDHMSAIATEWAHLSLGFFVHDEPLAGAFLALALVAILTRKPSLFDLGLTLLAFGLLRYVRLVPVAIVIVAPVAARRVGALVPDTRLTRVATYVALALLGPIALVRTDSERGAGWDPAHFPERAVAFIERAKPEGRMWNFSPYGGYLEWRLYPAYEVFIDGRVLDLPLAELAARSNVNVAAFESLRARFGQEWAVCRATEGESFCQPIARSRDWRMIYWDETTAIYVRLDGSNARLADDGYRVLRHSTSPEDALRTSMEAPDDDRVRALAHDGALAADQAPDSARAAFFAACGAIASRDPSRVASAMDHLSAIAPGHPALGALGEAWRRASR